MYQHQNNDCSIMMLGYKTENRFKVEIFLRYNTAVFVYVVLSNDKILSKKTFVLDEEGKIVWMLQLSNVHIAYVRFNAVD